MAVFSRPGKSHNLSMGIVGLPNVGKSTLFSALTKRSVATDNYPFCTTSYAEDKVECKDQRFDFLVKLYKPNSKIPANLSIVDIAGLIKGASEGLGLGNEFLSYIDFVDGIFHLVRCFEDENIIHVDNSVDPIRDVQTIKDELRLKDLKMITKLSNKQKRENVIDPVKKKFEALTLQKLLVVLQTKWVNEADWTMEEVHFISTMKLLTIKEVIYLANISDEEYKNNVENKHLKALMASEKNVLKFSATDLSDNFIDMLVKKGYESLGLITYFTAGEKEVKAWTVRKGTKAPQASSIIHTDFEKNFIKAEVMKFSDIEKYGNEQNVKKAGRYLVKGREYEVEDGDIIFFKTGRASNSQKKK